MLRKYQDFTRMPLAQVLRLARCANRDQNYPPLRRVPEDTDSLFYLISQYPDSGIFSPEDVDSLAKEAADDWGYSGVRLRQTREPVKADITIRFCGFSECYGRNLSQVFDLTGATLDRTGEGWTILVNTELPLADERAPFVFPPQPNTHQQIQLTQVHIQVISHKLSKLLHIILTLRLLGV